MGKTRKGNQLIMLTVLVIGVAVAVFLASNLKIPQNLSLEAKEGSSCYVNPNPVEINKDYTIFGFGFEPGEMVNILIIDFNSSTSWNIKADKNGSTELVWHSKWKGKSAVKFYTTGNREAATLATCKFEVN